MLSNEKSQTYNLIASYKKIHNSGYFSLSESLKNPIRLAITSPFNKYLLVITLLLILYQKATLPIYWEPKALITCASDAELNDFYAIN